MRVGIVRILACAVLLVPAAAHAGWEHYETTKGDPVLYWNAVALQAVAEDHTGTYGAPEQGGPGKTARALAMVHIAMYDAANSIFRTHKEYTTSVYFGSSAQVSVDAAVAEAAYRVLVKLYPKQKQLFDTAYSGHMGEIPAGSRQSLGKIMGHLVALAVLDDRENDGADDMTMYMPSPLPGKHRVDPLNPMQPFLGPKWGAVKPFVLTSGSQFRAPPPPAIDSAEYAAAYDEVKRLGGDGAVTPTERLEHQMHMGLFWAYDGTKHMGTPPRLYNLIARQIAMHNGNSIAQNARLLALMNIAMADAGIGSWESKYFYNYWRPVLAIREADAGTGPTGQGDGNPATAGDPAWTPLGAPATNQSGKNFTPPFPAYPSGHATFGGAAFRTLEHFYGTDDMPFTFMSEELNGVTVDDQGVPRPNAPRTYMRFSDAVWENAMSRIYLGIHWKFDATEGIIMGNAIGDYTYANILQPLAP